MEKCQPLSTKIPSRHVLAPTTFNNCRRILGDLSNTQRQVQSPSHKRVIPDDFCTDFWKRSTNQRPRFDEEMLTTRFSHFKSAVHHVVSSHGCGNTSLEHEMHEGGTVCCGIISQLDTYFSFLVVGFSPLKQPASKVILLLPRGAVVAAVVAKSDLVSTWGPGFLVQKKLSV